MKNINFRPLFLIILLFCVFSCKKTDPNPELSDVIYLDLKTELEIAQKNLAAELDQNAKVRAELDAVAPQTGQHKYAQKRYFESLNSLDLYKQQVKYFEISIELRKAEAKNRYYESLRKNGRPWPDQAEIDDYRIRLKLQKAKLAWGKKPEPQSTQTEKKDVPRGTGDEKAAAPSGKQH